MTAPLPNDGTSRRSAWPQTSLFAHSGPPDPVDALADRLVADLAGAWQRGEEQGTEKYLADYPELQGHPEAALRLVYEEVCLRQEAGQDVAVDEVCRRFPQWENELRVMLDFHRLLEPPAAAPAFPQAGTAWAGFRLLAELGRGALGRVFLATQPDLANRPVVLKLTPCTGSEHLSLARLQHTGIVPLLDAKTDPAADVRTLVMPYHGGVTLARLLEALKDKPPAQRTGQDILRVLDADREKAPVPLPQRRSIRDQVYARVSYTEAVCVIGALLADALQFAHNRRLVHLDVKPSNVLLAADGQPMLLDFHLAQEPIRPDGPPPAWVGGTLAYMPHEQQAAMAAVNAGRPVTDVVDARADVYSLGVTLYEALGGRARFLPGDSPPLERINPSVSPGLSDIIARCTARFARDRYPDAAALADDLRRHLNHQKLRGVRNRSWRERWDKWRRRSPAGLRLWLFSLLAVAGVVAAGIFYQDHAAARQEQEDARRAQAGVDLRSAQKMLDRGDHTMAVAAAEHGLKLVEHDPGVRPLALELVELRNRAQRAGAAHALHRVAEEARFLAAAQEPLPVTMRWLWQRCDTAWEKGRQLRARKGVRLSPAAERQIDTDLIDVALIGSDMHVRLAADEARDQARREVLGRLDEVERLCGRSPALEFERQRQAAGRGGVVPAVGAGPTRPRTAWDYCLLGRARLQARERDGAAAALRQAVDLDPSAFWPHYYRAVCEFQRGRYREAAHAFDNCIAVRPASAVCFYNRGLCDKRLKDGDRALYDFGQAVKSGKDRTGVDPAAAYYQMAVLYNDRGDRRAARECLAKALVDNPGHPAARELLRQLGGGPAPKGDPRRRPAKK
jgi:serine/threonine protein kinase